MYHSILVPLDGSGFGEQALPAAVHVARGAGAKLHLVHVHAPPAAVENGGQRGTDVLGLKEQKRAYLEGLTQRLAGETKLPVSSTLLEGPVADALQEYVQSLRPDLVVMTTHGRGPLSRFWLGSTADEMLRRLPVPLLLVPPRDKAGEQPRAWGFKHVLLPLDGTALAEQILRPAVALGQLDGAEFTLLRVVEPRPAAGAVLLPGLEVGDVPRPGADQLCEHAQVYLEQVAPRLRGAGLRAQTAVVLHATPAVAILEEAERRQAQLIALQTHGRRGLSRLLLGSVADKVVRGARVPVLTHRPAAM